MENVRNHSEIKAIITKTKRNCLINNKLHNANFISKNLLKIEIKKNILMYKPVFLDLPISEVSKALMYKFWCDYAKSKYEEKSKVFFHNKE